MAVTFQEFFTVRKKIRTRKTIVLQDYALRFILEEPGYPTTNSSTATEVLFEKKGLHFARPIHSCGNTPGFST
jgi:hypothetical protein